MDAIDDRLDELPRREVLASSLGRFFGALGEQPFVDVSLHVGFHARPLHRFYEIDDQSPQRGRVLNVGPSLLENLAEHPRLLAEFLQRVPVMDLKFIPLLLEQRLPTMLRRHDGRPAVRRLGHLIGHLQEEEKRDLLRVGHVRQPVVAQDVREVPGFGDDLLGVVIAHGVGGVPVR